tara:strand:+ start:70 stop:609 length:540 start_codon:yes stop_codon:yes gene_type:complete
MAMTLLADNTADTTDLASVEFTSGIDSTYKLYIFKFYDVNPATDSVHFQMEGSTDSGSSYGVTKTTTAFRAIHNEPDSAASLSYETSNDLAQSTDAQVLAESVGNGADECCAGEIFLFNPASTTYVKHFLSRSQYYQAGDYSIDFAAAGYWNTTSAVDAVQFTMSSGNMDAVIKMYGVG